MTWSDITFWKVLWLAPVFVTLVCMVLFIPAFFAYKLKLISEIYLRILMVGFMVSLTFWLGVGLVDSYQSSQRLNAVFSCLRKQQSVKVDRQEIKRREEFLDDFSANHGGGLMRMTGGDTLYLGCRCIGDSLTFLLIRQNEDPHYFEVFEGDSSFNEVPSFVFKTSTLDDY